jgi:hypothetical protein
MELAPITCQNCGAALDVPPAARFVTCSHCGSRLEIKRTPSAVFTEVLDRIDQRTAAMADDLGALRRDSEIERLDREWAARVAELGSRSKDGSVAPPSAVGGMVAIFVMGGFGIFWTIMAFTMTRQASAVGAGFPGSPGMPGGSSGPTSLLSCVFPAFGILFVIAAVVLGIKTLASSSTYQQELRTYQERRRQLLAGRENPPAR